ncbi:MAG TPA: cytochrome c peroxidase [Steroidobacteraceae bacterium]|jgi:cytochrome c553
MLWMATGNSAHSAPVADGRSGLPLGTELDEDAPNNPREIFHSEATRGRKSYMSNLGNLAFNSPYTLGEAARKAHISCASCHVNGAANPRLFVPGLSTRPGTFDTTNALFNPKTDNGVLDAVSIPSLRGARFLGPYGHDGRIASLRDFVRNVVVNEFAGAEPSPQVLDALVAYIEDIDFLPNPNLDKTARLNAGATPAQRRGETLFSKPFPREPNMSCASCHMPSAAFVDHRQHDVGSGGWYKTPTLLNADFNAPYFHDGRFDNFGQVIDYFNRVYELGLSEQDRTDLAAYLAALGDGTRPEYRLSGSNVLADINGFVSVLDLAIARKDTEVVTLAVRSGHDLLQDLADHYPDLTGHGLPGSVHANGVHELALARATVAALMQNLQNIQADFDKGLMSEAAAEYLNYRKLSFASAPLALQAAEPWSLFNKDNRARVTAVVGNAN